MLPLLLAYILPPNLLHQKQLQPTQTPHHILTYPNKQPHNIKKQKLLHPKEDNQILKQQPQNQLPERRPQLQTQQTPLLQKQQNFHPKSHLLHKK
ncbi:Rnase Y domain-containing protein, partial [Staphylococcus epidermidis]|uniref:Rnase Y domain-containing protein n=1 Tax=Staphylococcus epidermidis TaxID=1282 RepID=UPI0011A5439C